MIKYIILVSKKFIKALFYLDYTVALLYNTLEKSRKRGVCFENTKILEYIFDYN